MPGTKTDWGPAGPPWSKEEIGETLRLQPHEVERFEKMGHQFIQPTPEGGFSLKHPQDNPHMGAQFRGYKGGPGEATAQAFESEHAEGLERLDRSLAALGHHDEQTQLFDPDKIPLQEAHQQTPQQFANDPRTWWHGRYTQGGKITEEGESTGEGFHAGTKESAEERMSHRYPSEIWPGYAGHLYPLRITGNVIGPHNIHMDQGYHSQLQEHGRNTGYLYENAVEGAGTISLGVPHRQGYLSTHREMVQQAQAEGKHVHPLIQYAAEHHPEHTGEWRHPRFAEEEKKYKDWAGKGAVSSGQRSLFDADDVAPEQTSSRRAYETESGKLIHAVKMHQHPVLGGQWAESRYIDRPDWHTWGEKMF